MNYENLISGAKILAIFVSIGFGLFMLFNYANIKGDLAQSEYENASLKLKLESQNEAIEKLKIDNESYLKQKPKIQKEIIYKYLKEPPSSQDSSCETRILYLQNQVKKFYKENE